jgi:hypothetical protein
MTHKCGMHAMPAYPTERNNTTLDRKEQDSGARGRVLERKRGGRFDQGERWPADRSGDQDGIVDT